MRVRSVRPTRAPLLPPGGSSWRSPSASRLALVLAFSCVLELVGAAALRAGPIVFGDKLVKPFAWPGDATINVYVQPDPKKKDRDALVKEGVERWVKPLADRGITLKVTI